MLCQIATGVYPDMTEHGATSDAWPALYERVMSADILVLGAGGIPAYGNQRTAWDEASKADEDNPEHR